MKDYRFFSKTFLIILFYTSFIGLFSVGGTYAIETYYPKQSYFPDGTMLSSIPISGLSEAEAKDAVRSEIENWKSSASLSIVYFDEAVELDTSQIEFFIQESLQGVENGYGDLYSNVSSMTLKKAIESLSYDVNTINLNSLTEEVQTYVNLLSTSPLFIDINDYVSPNRPIEVVASSVTTNFESTLLLPRWVEQLDGVVIDGRSRFSLLQTMADLGAVRTETESLNVLATALYNLFLETNFQFIERHGGRVLPNYADAGYYSVVKPDQADLIVENPNYYSYTLKLALVNNELTASLEGVSLPYQFTAVTKNEKVIVPRKVVHFSSTRRKGDKQIVENGKNGYFVELYRQIRNKESNKLIKEYLLFEDFYSPVHQVEEWSIKERLEQLRNANDIEEQLDKGELLPQPVEDQDDIGSDEQYFDEADELMKGY
ncbi:hypothetical protein BKP45_12380 [Anaerobacillus alkalidiazotrophicus]|uniref:G5 domain-containing protein n=1 Tax=Anaerobacillus alkalidiazotrophicus TaxID=472963 RepID=A0A1S2M1B5_9BACI|nr:VanW family protein [Anaerobacillus alkalidiazotrophicus]OIJ18366.1 hypothetical protein BKP45_18095 [Anaerobacillus alkalidiazotrophicus]OIJ19845.1 hypothetical protein BKP45_12380 [Anaerobacillus alkalidiazotrophicus]